MGSDQLTGAVLKIYAVSPDGRRVKLWQGVNEQSGPGGSPDGVQATVVDDGLPFMSKNPFPLKGGDTLLVTGIMRVADGADASDSVLNIPILRNGQMETLTRTDVRYTVDIPAASVIDIEHQLGLGYVVPQNDVIQLGGGKYFMSWEDDA